MVGADAIGRDYASCIIFFTHIYIYYIFINFIYRYFICARYNKDIYIYCISLFVYIFTYSTYYINVASVTVDLSTLFDHAASETGFTFNLCVMGMESDV